MVSANFQWRACRAGAAVMGAWALLSVTPAAAADGQQVAALSDLGQLSIEELANLEITSVSRAPEPVATAPAAIFVITREDIRRWGAATLPEVLRLAPNLQVGRIDALAYAISARGFNSIEASNKLLVLIDGRSVYTPLHSGVLWEAQNVMVEAIDRVEVVSGPGGALWGANAVNGVINVITRPAKDTQGPYVAVGYGNIQKNIALRYGGTLGGNLAYRVYATGSQRGPLESAPGAPVDGEWEGTQGGFRADWSSGGNAFTVQGDAFNRQRNEFGEWSGGNVLARWDHSWNDNAHVQVQAYYDRTDRSTILVFDKLDTYDIALQHNFLAAPNHAVVWGGGYRVTKDLFVNDLNAFNLEPKGRTQGLANLFAQDQVALSEQLALTLGMKLEHNDFTGFEYMPNLRLAWRAPDDTLLWGAVSRAVRTPSRIDRELQAPGILLTAPNFHSEKLIAFEAGYRSQPVAGTSLSISAFYNLYDDIRTTELSPAGGLPLRLGNGLEGNTYGLEVWGNYSPFEWWQLRAGFSALDKRLTLKAGHTDVSQMQAAGNDPHFQASLYSLLEIRPGLELDLALRAVDRLTNPEVPGYVEADARLGWRIADAIELSLAGYNLLHDHHVEAVDLPTQNAVPRSVYIRARWGL